MDPLSEEGERWRRKRKKMLLTALVALLIVDDSDEEEEPPRKRAKLVRRQRRAWNTYVQPMLADKTFRKRFRLSHDDFNVLVGLLRPKLERNRKMGALRNGAIPVEFQLAMALRYLAGGSIYELMDGHVVAKTTAYDIVHRVIDALNECRALDLVWPEGEEVCEHQANLFKIRSTNDVILKAIGALDGLFLRVIRPTVAFHRHPIVFYSGHKKGYGLNFQAICNANYEIIAYTLNCAGSRNDRTAFHASGFPALLDLLPPGYFILGDAAYPPSDRVLVPYPGTKLSASQDAYNFYQSQCRISIEQTFGIMVRTWGVLWRPMEIKLDRVNHVMNSIVRLHNLCRRSRSEVHPSMGVTLPNNVRFNSKGRIEGNLFQTAASRGRPPSGDCLPREAIRARIEAETLMRPRWNLERNADRWPIV